MFFKIKNMKGQKIPGGAGGSNPAYGLWSDHRTIPTMVRPSDHGRTMVYDIQASGG